MSEFCSMSSLEDCWTVSSYAPFESLGKDFKICLWQTGLSNVVSKLLIDGNLQNVLCDPRFSVYLRPHSRATWFETSLLVRTGRLQAFVHNHRQGDSSTRCNVLGPFMSTKMQLFARFNTI